MTDESSPLPSPPPLPEPYRQAMTIAAEIDSLNNLAMTARNAYVAKRVSYPHSADPYLTSSIAARTIRFEFYRTPFFKGLEARRRILTQQLNSIIDSFDSYFPSEPPSHSLSTILADLWKNDPTHD